jgi:hypothetical protein
MEIKVARWHNRGSNFEFKCRDTEQGGLLKKFLWLALLLAGIFSAACGSKGGNTLGSNAGNGNGSGANCGSLPGYTILNAGVLGTWLGLPVLADGHANVVGAGPANPLSGNPVTLQVTTNCTDAACTYYADTPLVDLTVCPAGVTCVQNTLVSDSYISCGRIEFDLKIDLPISDLTGVWIYWGSSACARGFYIAPGSLSAAFKRYSVPLSSFTAAAPCGEDMGLPFQVSLARRYNSASGAGFCLDNVHWIGN